MIVTVSSFTTVQHSQGIGVGVGVGVAVGVGVEVGVNVGVGVGVNVAVGVGVGVGVGPQSLQSAASEQVTLQSYSPNNPPSGLLTTIIEPASRQWFLLAPANKFGDCSVPPQLVTV